MSNAYGAVRDQMRAGGIDPPEELVADGRIHRFRSDARKKGAAGWYVLHEHATRAGRFYLGGRFGCYRLGVDEVVRPDFELDASERAEARAAAERDRRAYAKQRAEASALAARRAARLWASSAPARGDEAYLVRKGVAAYGVRVRRDGVVVVPAFDVAGKLRAVQLIFEPTRGRAGGAAPGKLYWPKNCVMQGARFVIGGPVAAGAAAVVLCEGYATGASIHAATGLPVVVAFSGGNLPILARELGALLGPGRVVVAGDDDVENAQNAGRKYAVQAATLCEGRAVFPHFAERRPGQTDFNDLARAEGEPVVRQQLQSDRRVRAAGVWRGALRVTKAGVIVGCLPNLLEILERDEGLALRIAFNEFDRRVYIREPLPWSRVGVRFPCEWDSESDAIEFRVWLNRAYGVTASTLDVEDAVNGAARRAPYHPVRDYLQCARAAWDGVNRLSTWLHDYLGVEEDDYSANVGRWWLVSAVARVFQPGAHIRGMLILEGEQYKGKSTALEILGGEWYSDTGISLGNRDSWTQIQGVWIYEFPELDSLNRADENRAKAFLTSSVDRYRPAFARRVQSFPRETVFAGTTNQGAYLKDVTGGTRFWPVVCEELKARELRRDRDQLWGEAVARYERGERWFPAKGESDRLAEEVERREIGDAWVEYILDYVDAPERRLRNAFTARELLNSGLGLQAYQIRAPENARIGRLMQGLGWRSDRRTVEGLRVRVYIRPGAPPASAAELNERVPPAPSKVH
jgi:putative DNA primase/helicase